MPLFSDPLLATRRASLVRPAAAEIETRANALFDGGAARRRTGRLLRVLVLVMILEADLVNVFVRVAVVPVRVLVGDVLMLMAVVGVRVRIVMMRVLVVV